MRNEPTLRKKFKNLLYTSAKPGLSIEEAILHCLLQIYGINIVAVAMFMILWQCCEDKYLSLDIIVNNVAGNPSEG